MIEKIIDGTVIDVRNISSISPIDVTPSSAKYSINKNNGHTVEIGLSSDYESHVAIIIFQTKIMVDDGSFSMKVPIKKRISAQKVYDECISIVRSFSSHHPSNPGTIYVSGVSILSGSRDGIHELFHNTFSRIKVVSPMAMSLAEDRDNLIKAWRESASHGISKP